MGDFPESVATGAGKSLPTTGASLTGRPCSEALDAAPAACLGRPPPVRI